MLLLGQITFNPPRMQHLSPFKRHPATPLLGEKSISLSPISRLAPSAACLGGAPTPPTMKSFSPHITSSCCSSTRAEVCPVHLHPEEHLSSSRHKGSRSGAAETLVCAGAEQYLKETLLKSGYFQVKNRATLHIGLVPISLSRKNKLIFLFFPVCERFWACFCIFPTGSAALQEPFSRQENTGFL